MQIKLVILTICASLAAIGFATPSPQGDLNADESDISIPSDEQTHPGIDNLGPPNESIEDLTLVNPNSESMAVLERRRGRGGRGYRRRRKQRKMKKKELPKAPQSI